MSVIRMNRPATPQDWSGTLTRRHGIACGGVVCAALVIAACGSGSPTSPSATGLSTTGALPEQAAAITIPGLPAIPVTLKTSAPVAQTPATDSIVRSQTVQLVVTSPVATYVQATLQVTYELWKISGGTPTMVFNPTVSAGSGTTSVMTDTLEDSQDYTWRAFASLDGATGLASTPFTFRTEFKAIEPPTLVSPIGGATATGRRPLLHVNNGAVVGNVGSVIYQFEIDTSPSFANPVRVESARVGDTGDRTTGTLTENLPLLTTFYWRVRGTDGTVVGAWSVTETFVTPDTLDEIDLSQVTFLHSNVSNWAITSTVTSTRISASEVCVYHTKAGQWPFSREVFPPDAEYPNGAPIEGNIWILGFINGQWYAATWDWLRPGQQCKHESADTFGRDQIGIPPMDGSWVPQKGDPIGLMMSTIARTSLRAGYERTNVVLVEWPY